MMNCMQDTRKCSPILFKMKELWSFLGPIFTNYEKYVKKIKKCEKLYKYDEAVEKLFEEQELDV